VALAFALLFRFQFRERDEETLELCLIGLTCCLLGRDEEASGFSPVNMSAGGDKLSLFLLISLLMQSVVLFVQQTIWHPFIIQ
jgi:hypothetical protein